jgi:hypothetical protein
MDLPVLEVSFQFGKQVNSAERVSCLFLSMLLSFVPNHNATNLGLRVQVVVNSSSNNTLFLLMDGNSFVTFTKNDDKLYGIFLH